MRNQLAGNTSIALVEFDEQGQIVAANARFCALVGMTADAIVGRDYWALTARGQKNRELNEIMAGRDDFEKEFVHADGHSLTTRVVMTSLGEADGQRRFTVGVKPIAHEAGGHDQVERVLRRQNAILLDLAKLGEIDSGQVEAAFKAITEAAAKGVGCERSSIWLYDTGETAIVCQDLFRISEADHGFKGFTLAAKDYPGYFEALAEDRTISADNAHLHPATREFSAGYLTPLGINSMLEAPIRRGGKLIGVLCNEHVGPVRSFTQTEMNFIASVAEIVTRALEASARREADDKLRVAHAELERHAADLEVKVAERTSQIQLILDNTGEGLLACDMAGMLTGGQSRMVGEWFGEPSSGTSAADFLFSDDAMARFVFEHGMDQIVGDILPFELIAEQMPRQFRRGDDIYRVRYREVMERDATSQVLIIVRHATEEVAAERAEQQARELQAMAGHLLRDRQGFRAFVSEMDVLVEDLFSDAGPIRRARALHTIKGNSGIYGLSSLAQLAHRIEEDIIERCGEVSSEMLRPVAESWRAALDRLERAFGSDDRESIVLSESEYHEFLDEISHRTIEPWLLARVRSWRYAPAVTILDRLSMQAKNAAAQLGKVMETTISGADLRVPLREIGDFWSSLVHVVRNAVDHGLETPGERATLGKATPGHLRMAVAQQDSELVVEIADNGRGIDWTGLRAKAATMGLACESRDDLIAALFADGLSTRDTATELSGRGVGLSAVLASCKHHGGRIDIESQPGTGTTFRFSLPIAMAIPQDGPSHAA